MRQWFEQPAGVQAADSDELQADVCAPIWGKGATRYDSDQALILESKVHIAERGLPSPDLGDALALTFARPIAFKEDEDDRRDKYKAKKRARGRSAWVA
jgi:hypothetical protein